MPKMGFESFSDTIDIFVRDEMLRNAESFINSSIIYGANEKIYRGNPAIHSDIESSIKDMSDGVAYFMIDFDRVGRPAKIGV